MVQTSSIAAMAVSMGIAILLPVILLVWLYRKEKISLKVAGLGAGIFFVFVLVLEGLLNFSVFKLVPGFFEDPFVYAIYGGLIAGIFEECGRYIAFRWMLKERREWKDGIAYGLGHGGFESIVVGGLSFLSLIIMSVMINNGNSAIQGEIPEIKDLTHTLQTQPWWMNLVGGVERAMALVVHIALSLVVLFGVRNKRPVFLLYSILLHALLNFPAGLFQKGVLNIWVTEGFVLLFAVASLIFLSRSKKFFPPSQGDITSHTSQQTP